MTRVKFVEQWECEHPQYNLTTHFFILVQQKYYCLDKNLLTNNSSLSSLKIVMKN